MKFQISKLDKKNSFDHKQWEMMETVIEDFPVNYDPMSVSRLAELQAIGLFVERFEYTSKNGHDLYSYKLDVATKRNHKGYVKALINNRPSKHKGLNTDSDWLRIKIVPDEEYEQFYGEKATTNN